MNNLIAYIINLLLNESWLNFFLMRNEGKKNFNTNKTINQTVFKYSTKISLLAMHFLCQIHVVMELDLEKLSLGFKHRTLP